MGLGFFVIVTFYVGSLICIGFGQSFTLTVVYLSKTPLVQFFPFPLWATRGIRTVQECIRCVVGHWNYRDRNSTRHFESSLIIKWGFQCIIHWFVPKFGYRQRFGFQILESKRVWSVFFHFEGKISTNGYCRGEPSVRQKRKGDVWKTTLGRVGWSVARNKKNSGNSSGRDESFRHRISCQ